MQTAYLPIQSLGSVDGSKLGGLCQWWYVPRQFIDSFGDVDPVTQQLLTPPTLKAGCTWYGPVNVPEKNKGWKQTMERAKAGPWYKQVVTGQILGNDINSHINRTNLAYYEVVVVALLRAGHFFIVLGNQDSGLSLDEETDGGGDQFDTHHTKLSFSGETEALVLTDFNGITSTPPPSAPGPYSIPTPGDHVGEYSYTANGAEGATLTIAELAGKSILLFARENVLLNVITTGSPTPRSVKQTGNDYTFAPDLQADEFIKIIYKS
jgi:hypothetical protein